MALRMGKELGLPIEATTEKLAFLGRTGSGKTYAAQKLAEEIDRNNGQFVALDPVGVWWSLRLAADGKRRGIQIPVFGGLNGDIPLEHTAGKLMADVVADRGISVVLDVSQFESDRQKNRFATDFGERFFFRKKAAPSAVHVFLEEAQEFVPQNLQGEGDEMVLHVFTRMWKLGRNYGIGGSLITQRPQEVNKKVLNLTEVLFAFQLTGTHERKSVAQWILDKGLDLDVEQLLPKLRQGQPHVWSPVLLDISKTVKISRKWTYDASSTPKVGSRTVVKTLAPIDLAKLRKDMAATIEKSKATDPKALQQRVRELEQQIAKKLPIQKIVGEKIKRVEVPMIKPAALNKMLAVARKLSAAVEPIAQLSAEIRSLAETSRKVKTPDFMPNAAEFTRNRAAAINAGSKVRFVQPSTFTKKHAKETAEANGKLQQGERALLTAIVQHGTVTRSQLTVLTGYRTSSIKTYLGFLSSKGLIINQRDDIQSTIAGQTALGDYERLPTGSALYTYWINKLPQGERKILEAVYPTGSDGIRMADIEEKTGYKLSSLKTYAGFLTSRKLITNQRGILTASEELYDH